MTQDANTLSPVDPTDDPLAAAAQELNATLAAQKTALLADAPESGIASRALAELESLGREAEVFAVGAGRELVAFVDHDIVPVGAGPHSLEAAQSLPEASPTETLFHVAENAVIRAFLDVGDEVKHVFTNTLGHFVKAKVS